MRAACLVLACVVGIAAALPPLPEFLLGRLDASALLPASSSAAEALLRDPKATPQCRMAAKEWLRRGRYAPDPVEAAPAVWRACVVSVVAAAPADRCVAGVAAAGPPLLAALTAAPRSEATVLATAAAMGGALQRCLDGHASPIVAVAARHLEPLLRPVAEVLLRRSDRDAALLGAVLAEPAAAQTGPWQFIPPIAGHAMPGGKPVAFKTRCFKTVSVTALPLSDDHGDKVELHVTAWGQVHSLCVETLVFYAGGTIALDLGLWDQLDHKVHLTVKGHTRGMAEAQLANTRAEGVAVMYQNRGFTDALVSLLYTVGYILGPMVSSRPELNIATEAVGAQMMNAYVPVAPMFQQAAPASWDPATVLRSGDLFVSTRLDGIDTLWNWIEGITGSHAAVVLCRAGAPGNNSRCEVCEARNEQSFWLLGNGVQCYPFDQWLREAQRASFLTWHVPLTTDRAQALRIPAMATFAKAKAGVDYGYQTWLFGWVDTVGRNAPCFPDGNFTTYCLSVEHYRALITVLDNILPTLADTLGGAGLRQRLRSHLRYYGGASVAEAFAMAREKLKLGPDAFVALPELDAYEYYSLRHGYIYNGTVFTSSAFACNLLREGGALGPAAADVECAEWTMFELLAADVYNTTAAAQVLGDYQFRPGPQMGSRPVTAGMGNACPTQGPSYERPPSC